MNIPINNLNSENINLRTPLAQKRENKNIPKEFNTDFKAGFSATPIETKDKLLKFASNVNETFKLNTDVENNYIKHLHIEENQGIHLTQENVAEDFINYNKNKNCSDNHFSKIKINFKDEEKFETKHSKLQQKEEKIENNETNQFFINSLCFLENENLIYLCLNDIKNLEKINNYIHEELCFNLE